ncbi:MAG: transcription antitermination factor NusB [Lachnospiraceae bacterium]|nr:transcription antitermination factor NusB [Lachnospiraceae bacterium]
MTEDSKKDLRERREHLMRLLYLREFHENEEIAEQNQLYFDVILPTEGIESDASPEILDKYNKLVEKLPEIDSVLIARMKNWNIERIGLVEKSLLRLCAYEIMFEGISEKIAINEAVELAKTYGGQQSGGFINGVLARIVKGLETDNEQ